MAYNHTNNIANQGDLIKHFALSCAIQQRPFTGDHFSYLEVHCGYAEYQLKTHGAWTKGIGEFIRRHAASDYSHPEFDYFYQLLALNTSGQHRHYPGSSNIVNRALRGKGIKNVTLHLCDTSAEVCASLSNSYQSHPHTHIYCEDGYSIARQLEGLDLVFIDPPDMDHHYSAYVELIEYCLDQQQPFVAWNSLHGDVARNAMAKQCQALETLARRAGIAIISVKWQQQWSLGMCGCQLLFSLEHANSVLESCEHLARLMQWDILR